MKRYLNLFLTAFLSLFIFSLASADNESSTLYNNKNDFLSADKAFKFKVYSFEDLKQLDIKFNIAPGYYLYKSKIKVSIDPSLDYKIILAKGKIKEDEFFGKQEVFYNSAAVKLLSKTPFHENYKVTLEYQGCSDKGLCYPPVSKIIQSSNIKKYSSNIEQSETDTIISKFSKQNFIITLIGFFLSGLLLSLTPCVLPMVPILSGIIISSNPKNALRLTLSYVGGITFTYTLLGIIAGMTGTLLSSSLQNTNFILFTGFLYVIFAMAMFGLFELTIPSTLQNKITLITQKFKIENSFNVFILGLASSLILSPCVAPPLAAAILYIGNSQDIILGGGSLFFMSLGMSAPLLAIGIFSIKIIPKPGPWMINIKKFMGFILLAMSIYIIRPLLMEIAFFSILFLIFIISIFYFTWSNNKAKNTTKIITTIFSFIIIGFIFLQTKPLLINSTQQHSHKFSPINNISELENLLTDSNKKPILLDFYADWCVACLEYEKFTFRDPYIIELMNKFELLQVDVTDNNKNHRLLLKEFDLFGPPGIIFFDSEGIEIKELKTIGFKNPKEFSSILIKAVK
jgi:thiol:disulfide interchange protein DsbD